MLSKSFLSQKVAKQVANLAQKGAIKLSLNVLIAKAKHAVYYRRDTKFHENLLANGNNIVLSLPNSMPIEGGVQLIYQDKTTGAIGISGAGSIEDGLIAKAGADFLLSFKEQ